MNRLLPCVFATAAALLMPAGAHSQQALPPHEKPFEGHLFFSSPVIYGNTYDLIYRVCNLSGDESAFYWSRAGFGVGAPNQVRNNDCAGFRRYEIAGAPFAPRSNVKFQSGGQGLIKTWAECAGTVADDETCAEDHVARVRTRIALLSFFGSGATETLTVEEFRYEVAMLEEARVIAARTTSGLPSIMVGFVADVDPASLPDFVFANADLQLRSGEDVTAEHRDDVLLSDVPPSMHFAVLPGQLDDGSSIRLEIKNGANPGDDLRFFALDPDGGLLAAISEPGS